MNNIRSDQIRSHHSFHVANRSPFALGFDRKKPTGAMVECRQRNELFCRRPHNDLISTNPTDVGIVVDVDVDVVVC